MEHSQHQHSLSSLEQLQKDKSSMNKKPENENVLISVVIPIYRESPLLIRNIQVLLEQNLEKEVVVVVDEPTEKTKEELKKVNGIKIITHEERVGKVNAVNEAITFCNGEVILFLDGDVELPDDNEFLRKIFDEMKDCDALDIKKVIVRDSFLAKLVYYDYASLNIFSWLSFKSTRKLITLNGAAFAVKKEVLLKLNGFSRMITEDIDLAIRLFMNGYKLKYSEKIFVYCYTHSSLRKWLKQRLRWAKGGAEIVATYNKRLMLEVIKNFEIFFPFLVFLFPSFFSLIFYPLVPNSMAYGIFTTILLSVGNVQQSFLTIAMLPWLKPTTAISLLKGVIAMTISTLMFFIVFYISSKKLSYSFSVVEFFLFYFVYSFLSFIVAVIGFAEVLILKKYQCENWRV
ncbi:MAG: glycosyltransferase [Thermoproteota archaeon]